MSDNGVAIVHLAQNNPANGKDIGRQMASGRNGFYWPHAITVMRGPRRDDIYVTIQGLRGAVNASVILSKDEAAQLAEALLVFARGPMLAALARTEA